jgi:hypothetical protein
MFQNMPDAVTADTNIYNYVRECTILVDGTKINRFSKELLAYIEMCVSTGRATHALRLSHIFHVLMCIILGQDLNGPTNRKKF